MKHDDPIAWFTEWYTEALKLETREPSSVTLATADKKGRPSARIVLLKGWDARGFVLYTNLDSRKGRELKENPQAALCFHWDPLGRQVRVRGAVQVVGDEEADAYWNSRARASQIGAHASAQSQPLASREVLLEKVAKIAAAHADQPVPRPAHWGGIRIIPEEIEFWSQGDFRLHDRFHFRREHGVWTCERISP